ncbi:hypothetical protein BRADI_3g23347v3 [Brachypodium distachyon]|uniref:Uncharacterized protein n=1 Tax=Brachypodium distachyon TaxID=15368 RepID=A0A2K2CZ34_BRADI|nr:hypothetical protein BRADI_3g23347v3 [Brachypodium distachyon]
MLVRQIKTRNVGDDVGSDSENEFNMKINCCNTFFRCCRDDVGEHQTSLSSLVMCYFPGLWPDYVLFWIHMCI